MSDVHEYLRGLKLYEKDEKLNQRFWFLVEEWRLAYPDVNLKSQIAYSHAWLVTNGPKKDYARYINNWLRRSQENASKREHIQQKVFSSPVYSVREEDCMSGDDWARMRQKLKGTAE